jgi:Bacterial surface proteins containing Ig-like domains
MAFKTVPVKSIKLDKSTLSLPVTRTYTLKVTISPANTTQKLFKFSTSNKNIATVDGQGVITAKKAGKADITVTSTSNVKITAKCSVTVTPVTLSILVTQNDQVTDWVNNPMTKFMENKFGITFKFVALPKSSDEAAQKLMLMLSTRNMPDVISAEPKLVISDVYSLAKSGVFINLKPYIEKYGVETKKMWESSSNIKMLMTYPDGNYYSLPYFSETYHANVLQRMYIYQPWLDKLNLKMPTTTDELYNVLKAFKERDPNGNGKADEVPLVGNNATTKTGRPYSFLMNAFIYYSVLKEDLYVDNNGKVIIPFAKDEWKNGLKYMNKLYAEGLMSPNTFTQDENGMKGMVMSDTPIVGSFTNRFSHTVTEWGTSSKGNLYKSFSVVPPLKGPNGFQVAVWRPYAGTRAFQYLISSTCKYPDLAFKVGDFLLSEEGTLWSMMGPEGVGWKKADPGEVGLDGSPAKYHQLIDSSQLKNVNWGGQLNINASAKMRNGFSAAGGSDNVEVYLYGITKQYEPYKVSAKNVLPQLFFTEDQQAKFTDFNQFITLVEEMTARFITGDLNIDTDWAKYVSELNKAGLGTYQKIYQEAYDSVKKNLK